MKSTPAFRFFVNLPTSNEAARAAEAVFRDRDRAAGMAGDLCLDIFFSFLLQARRCAAVRRCRGAYQHRAPRLRLENSGAVAVGDGVAAPAAPADHALHRVEADV